MVIRIRARRYSWLLVPTLVVLVGAALWINAQAQDAGGGLGLGQLFTPRPPSGGTLTYARDRDFDSLDPVMQADPSSWELTAVLFEGLVVPGDDAQPQGRLAQSWHVSEDGLSYTVHIRDGILFHDGQDLSASDVELSYLSFLAPGSTSFRQESLLPLRGVSAYLDHISRINRQLENGTIDESTWNQQAALAYADLEKQRPVEAVDGITVRFHLDHPFPMFMSTAGDLPILPRGTVDDIPVGTGPFRFYQHLPGQLLTVERNPTYHGQIPHLDRVTYLIIPREDDRMTALLSGRVNLTSLSPRALHNLDQSRYSTFVWAVPGQTAVSLNLEHEIFSDQSIRRALSLAIDKADLVERVYRGFGSPAFGALPPNSWAYSLPEGPLFDPYQAAELLEAVGWEMSHSGERIRGSQDLEISLLYPLGQPWEQVASYVAWSWEMIGVRPTPEALPVEELTARIMAGDYQAALVNLPGSADPDQYLTGVYGSAGTENVSRYQSADVDALLMEARQAGDTGDRRVIYLEIQAHISRDLPVIPLANEVACLVLDSRFQGLRPHFQGQWAVFYSLAGVSYAPR